MRKFILHNNLITNTKISIIFWLLLILLPQISCAQDKALEQYINRIVKEGSDLLTNNNLSQAQKIEKTKVLIIDTLDLDWMAVYTLGRNKKNVDSNKMKDFVQVYSKYVMQTYAALIENYKGEKTKVNSIRILDDKSYMVNTEIIKSDGVVKFKVEYLIHNLGSKENPKFKIADVVTEGISMITSQQAEFESIIMNEGIERLMQILNQKIGKEGNNLY